MPLVRGVNLALHPAPDYVSDLIRDTGDFYEPDILDELRLRVAGGVLVDVGAMIGNHTTFMAAFIRHTAIHAFEPLPANLALLRQNVVAYPTVTVHPAALSDRGEVLQLREEPGNAGHTSVKPVTDGVTVRALPLDAYQLDDVSLLKIDVEGHEPQVLAGARDTIARCKPLIVIEDWTGGYGALLPGYRLAVDWGERHQTFLYEPFSYVDNLISAG